MTCHYCGSTNVSPATKLRPAQCNACHKWAGGCESVTWGCLVCGVKQVSKLGDMVPESTCSGCGCVFSAADVAGVTA